MPDDPKLHVLHLLGATSEARSEVVDGREYLVVPVVALMEGVIHAVNADSPEFVPWETIERIAASFNDKPVTLGHPAQNGRQCSATVAGIVESHGIGRIRNSRAVKEGKKMLQEALIDKVRAKQLHPEMYQRLLDGKTEEVSVGALIVTDNVEGEHNGRRYKAAWLAGTGDHLAFLPGKRGACSVAMGCGAHRAAMLVTAEGFVDVPEVMPVLAFTTLEEQSLDERMQAVQIAINERWNKPTDGGAYGPMSAYAMQTFDDRVIVRVKDEVFAVNYEVLGGKATLGEAKRVKQAWVAAARKGKYEDCPTCKGSGNKDGNPCEACDGEGEVRVAALAALLGACGCNKAVKEIHQHAMKALGDKPGHPFYGNQHTGGEGGVAAGKTGIREVKNTDLKSGDRIRLRIDSSGYEATFGVQKVTPRGDGTVDVKVDDESVGNKGVLNWSSFGRTEVVKDGNDSDRDDLKSTFSASLKEARSMSAEDMAKQPTRTAMVVTEGALEDPSQAGALFDKASEAFNLMKEDTPRQVKAKTAAIRDFRFAFARERQRAEFAAPKRWAKVVKNISTPKTLEAFKRDEVLGRIKFEGGNWNLYGSDNALRLGRYNSFEEAEEHARAIKERLAR
jgi:hypothetical protein